MVANRRDQTPERDARAAAKRASAAEKALALAEFEQQAIAIRKNMARLRALREAKEAALQVEADAREAASPIKPKGRKAPRKAVADAAS